MFLNQNPNPMKANLCPQFNLNSTLAQFSSNSTKFQLNFISTLTSISTSTCPWFNLRLKSNSASISTSTWTQYSCDIKTTQSILCWCVVEKFKNFTFDVNLASGFQTEVAVVYIFKFIKHLTKYSDKKHKLILIDIRLYDIKLK